MLETCPAGYTNLCTEPLQGLPAINVAPGRRGDLHHIPASRLHASERSLIGVYFVFPFLEVCFVPSGELGLSRARLLRWGLEQELAKGPVRGSRRGARGSSEGI